MKKRRSPTHLPSRVNVNLSFLFVILIRTTNCLAFSVPGPKASSKHTDCNNDYPIGMQTSDLLPLEEEVNGQMMPRRNFIATIFAGTTAIAMSMPSDAEARQLPSSSSSSSSSETVSATETSVDWESIFKKASKRALGGGKAGASAAVVQVCSLMWLRTAMNYQYRYGGNLQSSLETLWSEGGLARLYQGLPFALVQGPMTRFGDTAANVGILALLDSFEQTAALPLPLRTACGSIAAGAWRIFLMPVDTSKTSMQVEGSDGLKRLWDKVGQEGPGPLYSGAFASAAATAVGHFPWFLTYNYLNDLLPIVQASDDLFLSLVRAAFLGLCASCVSDVCSNSLRVIKTTKQTAALGEPSAVASSTADSEVKELSYKETLDIILEKDGFQGLFGRGLQTRLLTNAIQGAAFSVLWKYFQQVGGM